MTTSRKRKITQSPLSRRDFLKKALIGLGVVGIAECGGIVVSFLWPRKPRTTDEDTNGIIEAGAVEDFPTPSVTPFRRGHFYLSRLEDGSFLALSVKCTHLGCAITWIPDESRFICPCHSSVFDMTGNVTNVPAPRALDLHPVIIENHMVKVDTNKRIQRKRFNISQVTHP